MLWLVERKALASECSLGICTIAIVCWFGNKELITTASQLYSNTSSLASYHFSLWACPRLPLDDPCTHKWDFNNRESVPVLRKLLSLVQDFFSENGKGSYSFLLKRKSRYEKRGAFTGLHRHLQRSHFPPLVFHPGLNPLPPSDAVRQQKHLL